MNYKVIIPLTTISIASFIYKISLVDFNSVVYLDAYLYLVFASNTIFSYGHLPGLHNIGFPLLLMPLFKASVFFTGKDFIVFSNIQRILTIILSCVTFPILYGFVRRFFDWKYALLGVGLFAIEPHLIYNSVRGLSESLYIFLLISSLYCMTSKNTRLQYISLIIAVLATITRFEGVMVILLSLLVIGRSKRKLLISGLIAASLLICFIIFSLYLLNQDVIREKIDHEILTMSNVLSNGHTLQTLTNSFIYMGWSTFPVFIWMIPIGLYLVRRNRFIIGSLVLFAIPGIIAYLRAFDTRYFVGIYPLLVLVSLYGIQWVKTRIVISKRITSFFLSEHVQYICLAVGAIVTGLYFMVK